MKIHSNKAILKNYETEDGSLVIPEIYDLTEPSFHFYLFPTDFYQILSVIIIFFSGCIIISILSGKFKINLFLSFAIYFWHTLFLCLYLFYTYYEKGDAAKYFDHSLRSAYFYLFEPIGTKFILAFTSIFSQFLYFNYLSVFLIYNLLGSLGVILLLDILVKNKIKSDLITNIIIITIIFLPSMNFWTVSIGKDSIFFFATSLLLWSIFNYKQNIYLRYLSLLILFLLRPHYGFIGLAIFLTYDLFFNKSSIKTLYLKIFVIIISIIVAPYIFLFLLDYVGYYSVTNYDQFTIKGFLNFIDVRSRYAHSDSFYNVSEMNYIYAIFTLLFRPLIFEVKNIFQLVISIENLILLIIVTFLIIKKLLSKLSIPHSITITLFFYMITLLFFLSISVGNFGIASRQKWMVLPILLVLLLTKPLTNEKSKY